MAKIEVQILDYENGVIGTLDITDSENFPLALSYLISDGRDLEQRFGDFSKSFDVPSTKNNNKLFENISNEKIVDYRRTTGLKDCRILVDSIEFFNGKIQVKGSKQSSKPLSYSCTIFGGNYGWISGLKDRNVCDIFGGEELLINGNFDVQVISGVSGNWIFNVGSPDLRWSNGQIEWTGVGWKDIHQNITSINNQLVVGDKYEVSFEITSYVSGSLGGRLTKTLGDTSYWSGANGVGIWSYIFVLGDDGTNFHPLNLGRLRLSSEAGGFIGTLDNISLKAVTTLEYTRTEIEDSWTKTQATSDVVYPLINYGAWDTTAGGSSSGGAWILDYNLASSTTKDMRPSFYLYNLIKRVFDNVGYQLESNFIEDADFKKLICHFPPDVNKLSQLRPPEVMVSRNYWNVDSPTGGDKGIWDNTITTTDYQVLSASNANSINSSSFADSGWNDIKNNLIIGDINGDYDSSTGIWTCPVGGRYSFNSIAELIIGNFENDQASAQYKECILNVFMRIVMDPNGFGFDETLAITSQDNSKVGGYDYSNFIGTHATSASSAQYPSESSIPLLNAVKVGISSEVTLDTGDMVKVQVKVKAKSQSTASNVRWGVAAVNDNFSKSVTGGGLIRFASPLSAYGSNFYDNQYVDNTINMWEIYETPYFKITPLSEDYQWGEIYKYSDILPCNISQVDFIKGIAHLFNLQFRTDMTIKTVYIEPFNEFYKDESLAYDWTNKLDLSKEIEDKYEINLKDKLSFQYKNDGSDGLMKYINTSFKEGGNEHNFFNYYEELGVDYPKGMTTFVNPVFSSTWCDWDPSIKGENSPPLVSTINKEESLYGWDLAHMHRTNVERPDKLFKYNPRILLYQGHIENPNSSNVTTDWAYHTQVSLGALGIYYDTQTPRATFVDWDNNSGDKFTNLSFNDETISPPRATPTLVQGLYSVYWERMIDQLKKNPRIRVMSINLSTSDIITLDLSKLVYINGTYWRINKIIDYAPLKNITTKVEFIQWDRFKSTDYYSRVSIWR